MAYTTKHSMLQKMREGDQKAWFEFREFYRPLIATRGKDYRLPPAEIDTLIQDVLVAVFKEHVLANYDQSKGHFRDYLRTITSRHARRILDQRPSATRIPPPPEDTPEQQDPLEQAWEEEWKQFLFQKALEELKAAVDTTTYMAFEMHVLQHQPAAQVAEILKLTPNQVYLIRTRNVAKLEEIIARLKKDLG